MSSEVIFMNKKGLFGSGMGGGGSSMKGLSFLLGLIILAMGLIPLLNKFGVTHINFNGVTGTVLYVILTIAGLFLIIDALKIQTF